MDHYEKLSALDIKLTRRSGQEKTFCPKCHSRRKNKRDRSLSVNITAGDYRCHNDDCDFKGNVREFEKKKDYKKLDRSEFIPKEIESGAKVKKWFAGRKITEKTMQRFMIYEKQEYMPQTQKKENCVCFPYFRDTDLVNIKFRDGAKNFKMVKDAELIFFNLNSIVENRKAIITEGEIDCMSAFEAGFGDSDKDRRYNEILFELKTKKREQLENENLLAKKEKRVAPNDLKNNPVTDHDVDFNEELEKLKAFVGWGTISVPNGASTGQMNLDYLENCAEYVMNLEEVFIATDNDKAGRELAAELVRRIGVEKCRIVKYPPGEVVQNKDGTRRGVKDLNEVLIHYGPSVVQGIIQSAESIRIEGIYYVEELFPQMLENFRHGIKMGETTRFWETDKFFRWKKGEQNLITGYGNHGKTFYWLQMMLIKSMYDGWKWGVFCPENYPPTDFYDDLIEMYVGRWVDRNDNNGMTEKQYTDAAAFLNDHFYFVYPEDSHSLDSIHEKFRYLILKKGIDGVLIDPWNQLDHVMGKYTREDQYLSESLTKTKRFCLLNNISYNIIAHPKNPTYSKEDNSLPVPDMYNLYGGSMWGNKMDNIIVYYRPNFHLDKSDPTVTVYTQKIKRKRTGGQLGHFDIKLIWKYKRYEEFNGTIPCDPERARNVMSGVEQGILTVGADYKQSGLFEEKSVDQESGEVFDKKNDGYPSLPARSATWKPFTAPGKRDDDTSNDDIENIKDLPF